MKKFQEKGSNLHSVDQNYAIPLGLEPRLFWTKTRRVANYTTG